MAELVVERIDGLEMLRMTSSGTEAAMSAIRLARGVTGRTKIVKFDGNYHGHVDALLAAAGSGVANQGLSGSAGVPASVVADTMVLPYNRCRRWPTTSQSSRSNPSPPTWDSYRRCRGFFKGFGTSAIGWERCSCSTR